MTQLTSVVDTIDQQRQDLVDQIVSGLDDLVSYFYERTSCSIDCSSTLLGALIRQMHVTGFLNPKPTSPFLGYSVASITTIVRGIRSPTQTFGNSYGYYVTHGCNLAAFLDPTVGSYEDGIEGLILKDFQS